MAGSKAKDVYKYHNLRTLGVYTANLQPAPWQRLDPDGKETVEAGHLKVFASSFPLYQYSKFWGVPASPDRFPRAASAGFTGFNTVADLYGFLDTDGGDIFGPFCRYDNGHQLQTMLGHKNFLSKLKELMDAADTESAALMDIQLGDTDILNRFLPGESVQIRLILAATYAGLRFTSNGLTNHEKELWFYPGPGNHEPDMVLILGYTVDEWLQAYQLFRTFIHYRHTRRAREAPSDEKKHKPPVSSKNNNALLPIYRDKTPDLYGVESVVASGAASTAQNARVQDMLRRKLHGLQATAHRVYDPYMLHELADDLARETPTGERIGQVGAQLMRVLQADRWTQEATRTLIYLRRPYGSMRARTLTERSRQHQIAGPAALDGSASASASATAPSALPEERQRFDDRTTELLLQLCDALSRPQFGASSALFAPSMKNTERVLTFLSIDEADLGSGSSALIETMAEAMRERAAPLTVGDGVTERALLKRARYVSRLLFETQSRYVRYDEAMARTGLNWSADYRTAALPNGGSMAFRVHQVIDAATALSMLDKPPRSCLLANETGTGKTATFILVLYRTIQESFLAKGPFRPSLVVLPAGTLRQTFHEFHHAFPGFFHIIVYYGVADPPSNTSSAETRSFNGSCLRRAAFRSRLSELRKATKNKDTARTIILTSYDTFARREFNFPTRTERFTSLSSAKAVPVPRVYTNKVDGSAGEVDANAEADSEDEVDANAEADSEEEVDANSEADSEDEVDANNSEAESADEDGADVDADSDAGSGWGESADEAEDGSESESESESEDEPEIESEDESEDESEIKAKKGKDNDGMNADEIRDRYYDQLVDAPYASQSIRAIVFSVVVFDECQKLRSPVSRACRLAVLLKKEKLVLVSATPFLNTINDIYGVLTVVAHHAQWYYDIPKSLPGAKALLSKSYQPTDSIPGWGALFSPERLAAHPGLRRLHDAGVTAGSRAPWILHPNLISLVGKHAQWQGRYLSSIIRRALSIFQLRRSMRTQIVLPDGQVATPGEAIPMHRTRMTLVSGPDDDATELLARIVAERAKSRAVRKAELRAALDEGLEAALAMFQGTSPVAVRVLPKPTKSDDGSGADADDDADGADDDAALDGAASDHGAALDGPDADGGDSHMAVSASSGQASGTSANAAVHRAASDTAPSEGSSRRSERQAAVEARQALAAMSDELSADDEKDLTFVPDLDDEVLLPHKKAVKLVKMYLRNLQSADYRLAQMYSLSMELAVLILLRKRNYAAPFLGVEQTDGLRGRGRAAAIRWIAGNTSLHGAMAPEPTSRIDCILHVIRHSPVMARLLSYGLQMHADQRRFIVITDLVIAQELAIELLEEVGLVVLSIHAEDTQAERSATVAQFNDPTARVDAIVLCYAVSSYGINLHRACANGILLEFTWTANAMLQAIGRLVRLGQTKPVEWEIVRARGSFSVVQERRVCRKWVTHLHYTTVDDKIYPSAVARLICYEIIRAAWQQPFNRYAWELGDEPDGLLDYDSEENERLGSYLSSLCYRCISHPDEALRRAMQERFQNRRMELRDAWRAAGCPLEARGPTSILSLLSLGPDDIQDTDDNGSDNGMPVPAGGDVSDEDSQEDAPAEIVYTLTESYRTARRGKARVMGRGDEGPKETDAAIVLDPFGRYASALRDAYLSLPDSIAPPSDVVSVADTDGGDDAVHSYHDSGSDDDEQGDNMLPSPTDMSHLSASARRYRESLLSLVSAEELRDYYGPRNRPSHHSQAPLAESVASPVAEAEPATDPEDESGKESLPDAQLVHLVRTTIDAANDRLIPPAAAASVSAGDSNHLRMLGAEPTRLVPVSKKRKRPSSLKLAVSSKKKYRGKTPSTPTPTARQQKHAAVPTAKASLAEPAVTPGPSTEASAPTTQTPAPVTTPGESNKNKTRASAKKKSKGKKKAAAAAAAAAAATSETPAPPTMPQRGAMSQPQTPAEPETSVPTAEPEASAPPATPQTPAPVTTPGESKRKKTRASAKKRKSKGKKKAAAAAAATSETPAPPTMPQRGAMSQPQTPAEPEASAPPATPQTPAPTAPLRTSPRTKTKTPGNASSNDKTKTPMPAATPGTSVKRRSVEPLTPGKSSKRQRTATPTSSAAAAKGSAKQTPRKKRTPTPRRSLSLSSASGPGSPDRHRVMPTVEEHDSE